jgi:uncharacterized membrane protein
MSARSWGPPIVLVSSALAMFAGVAAHGASPLRTLLVACFLVVAPGLAVVGLLRLGDPWLQAALVPALSLGIDATVGGLLAYSGQWSPAAAILILVGISVLGAFGQDLAAYRRRRLR